MPSSPSPANQATGVSVDADLNWSGGAPDADDTVNYTVYFGTNSTPPFRETIGPYVANQTSITYDPGTMNYSTKYYWKIVATDNHGASTAGPVWDFTTQQAGVSATMEGHVSFSGRGSNNTKWAEPFNVTLFEPGNLSHVLWTGNATTDNTGVFTVSGLTAGTYGIGIKNWTCLSELNTSVTLSAGMTTVVDFGITREGDANNDDYVNILDASSLASSYGSSEGGPDWNAHCDFNRDGNINILDASALTGNYGQHGDLA
jgi:hypothetical protein